MYGLSSYLHGPLQLNNLTLISPPRVWFLEPKNIVVQKSFFPHSVRPRWLFDLLIICGTMEERQKYAKLESFGKKTRESRFKYTMYFYQIAQLVIHQTLVKRAEFFII